MIINGKKAIIKNQKYEKYWATTMALTDWNSDQFIRTLEIIINHIDKYKLSEKKFEEVVKNKNSKRYHLNNNVVHNDELIGIISRVFPNDDKTGATTRKQVNEYIKLGFIAPFYMGYPSKSKEYIKAGNSDEKRKQLFSDIVYSYSSFNSSQTINDTENNQMKFLVNTLLNKKNKKLTHEEIIALMNIDISNGKKYAIEKEINQNLEWFKTIDFDKRKYNQISHLKSIIRGMEFLQVNDKPFEVFLAKDSEEFLIPEKGSTIRDSYRFGVMKKAVYDESIKIYGKKVSWISKQESAVYVVSHIKDSAICLAEWDYDAAYDPNNAILLLQGDEDHYFDKKKITIDGRGNLIFSEDVKQYFIDKSSRFGLDKEILNDNRKNYLEWHNEEFEKKYNINV